jgi:RNase H-fold protein (predicted Holliday junction resolvase)
MNILWIDWWTKYIWLAKKDTKHNMIMPVWYINNDAWTMFELANIIEQYQIKKIVVWWPTKQKDIQEKIEKFINELSLIYPDIEIIKVDEDYTSVQAWETKWDFTRSKWEDDTIAAMKILERYKN